MRAWELNAEHKPDGAREQPRVEAAGGHVREKRWEDGVELPVTRIRSAKARRRSLHRRGRARERGGA